MPTSASACRAKSLLKRPELPAEFFLSDEFGRARLFVNRRARIEARSAGEVPGALAALDRERAAGRFVAGWICYEALDGAGGAGALPEADLRPRLAPALLRFGVYDSFESIDSKRWLNATAPFALHDRQTPDEQAAERDRFLARVDEIRERLAAGRAYQINLTQSAPLQFDGDRAGLQALYARLRALQPTSHSSLFVEEDFAALSLSPELFFSFGKSADGQWRVETRPMKGTAPRSLDPAADRALALALASDTKTRAENLMILDLLRNDLGRLASPGAVRVDAALTVESYPSLHQMVSRISATLDEPTAGRLLELGFAALFPSGSVTGAPRLEARRIIRELEPEPRGLYCGAIGFAGRDEAEFSVAIRTLEIELPGGRARYGRGCGIVWDSTPEEELRERDLKTAFLRPVLSGFRLIETLRAEGGRIWFLDEHLDRMTTAAERFAIPCDREALRARWLEVARSCAVRGPQRLRATLDAQGELQLEYSPLDEPFAWPGVSAAPRSLALATESVWSRDPFRSVKSSERRLYDETFARVRAAGFDDAVFLNEAGEIVETAICNILIHAGPRRWLTPALECGALPGAALARLEARAPGRISRVRLKLADALAAGPWFVVNSVRGLRRATLKT